MKRFARALCWPPLSRSACSVYEFPCRSHSSRNRKAALDRIRTGADVNEAQPDGTRPIHWAVYKVDYELIAALIAKKAKVDVVNEFGSTPLAEAVKLADARMVKMLRCRSGSRSCGRERPDRFDAGDRRRGNCPSSRCWSKPAPTSVRLSSFNTRPL